MSKLLALDQSSRITGYAIFENAKLIHYGKFTIEENDVGMRLLKIRQNVYNLIKEYDISEVVFEDIQLQDDVNNNVQTFKTLSEVFGIISELMAELNLPSTVVPSTVWKSTLKIKGKTRPEQKKNAQALVEKTFGIKLSQDESDAICIGLHYIIKPLQEDRAFNWSD